MLGFSRRRNAVDGERARRRAEFVAEDVDVLARQVRVVLVSVVVRRIHRVHEDVAAGGQGDRADDRRRAERAEPDEREAGCAECGAGQPNARRGFELARDSNISKSNPALSQTARDAHVGQPCHITQTLQSASHYRRSLLSRVI
ncbi:MAG TPA: hypothetical protein VF155_07105 [Candidatus Dormibacteraeota bacterium]